MKTIRLLAVFAIPFLSLGQANAQRQASAPPAASRQSAPSRPAPAPQVRTQPRQTQQVQQPRNDRRSSRLGIQNRAQNFGRNDGFRNDNNGRRCHDGRGWHNLIFWNGVTGYWYDSIWYPYYGPVWYPPVYYQNPYGYTQPMLTSGGLKVAMFNETDTVAQIYLNGKSQKTTQPGSPWSKTLGRGWNREQGASLAVKFCTDPKCKNPGTMQYLDIRLDPDSANRDSVTYTLTGDKENGYRIDYAEPQN